jgi:sigma54-dependent transcription regulator
MNVESRKKWIMFGLAPSAQWRVSLALLAAMASPVPSFSQGTLEQRLACTPDVLRLCSAFIPNADEITICLREKNAELSDACKTAFEAGIKQQSNAGDSTQSRKRTAK